MASSCDRRKSPVEGSVLESVLFNLFIHDLEKRVNSKGTKVANDARLFKILRREPGELQKDYNPRELGNKMPDETQHAYI